MKSASRSIPAFWLVYVVLGLFVFLVGARSGQTIDRVLTGDTPAGVAAAEVVRVQTRTEVLARRDSLLASAEITGRDPFRPVSKRRARPTPTPNAPERVEPASPELEALLFDAFMPSVRIRIGDAQSTWLHEGDGFAGWSVVSISQSSVEIRKGTQAVILN